MSYFVEDAPSVKEIKRRVGGFEVLFSYVSGKRLVRPANRRIVFTDTEKRVLAEYFNNADPQYETVFEMERTKK